MDCARPSKWDCVLTRESARYRRWSRAHLFFFPLSSVACALLSRLVSLSPDSTYVCACVSLPSDANCLLPNLIRNFRRRGNLTSFLFSLAHSFARSFAIYSVSLSYAYTLVAAALRASCRGSRSQDFSIHGRRPTQLINLCVAVVAVVAARQPRTKDKMKCLKMHGGTE